MQYKLQASALLFFCLSMRVALAANLCDAECALTIDFPSGGYLEATEALTITFGDSGLIDTVSSVTAYLDGEILTLNRGDRLEFGAGGRFDIGSSGNIDYTDLLIHTNGVINLDTVGGLEALSIAPGNTLSIYGDTNFRIDALTVAFEGRLELGVGSMLTLFNFLSLGCQVNNNQGPAISISNVNEAVTPDNLACDSVLFNGTVAPVNPADVPPPLDSGTPDGDTSGSGLSDATAISIYSIPLFLILLGFRIFRKSRRS